MKRTILLLIAIGLLPLMNLGCAEKSSTKSTTTVTTPKGETTITTQKEVKKTGENPPDAPK